MSEFRTWARGEVAPEDATAPERALHLALWGDLLMHMPDKKPRSREDIVAATLMSNLDLTKDDQWVMDEDSPRSMAQKIIAALDDETP